MSKEDEIFDEFLRSKFESKKFTNKPHYWHNAQEMIAHGRKSNSSFSTLIVGSIVLVAAIGLGLLLTRQSVFVPANNNALTASSVAVGTSTTSNYGMNVTAKPASQTGEMSVSSAPDQNLNNTPHHTAGTNATPLDKTPKHPGRGKKATRNKHNYNAATSVSDENIRYNSTSEVIDINGKTFTMPRNTDPSAVTSYTKTQAYISYASEAQKSFVAVEAGVNMYNPGNEDILNSVKGHVGIRYYRFVGPQFALSTGLTYAMQHQNLPGRSFASTDYDFGKNSSTTTITTQRLDYIELPVSALYQLTPSHSLTAGATFGYVIQSYDKLTDMSGNTSHQKGYLNAINRWDTQLDLGYQYTITPQFWIRTSVHMGLMDISDNTLFKQNETNTNKGIRVTLGYKVF